MKKFTIDSLIVHGVCPDCKELSALVSILDNIYKCTNCGNELEQYVNGVIKYLPMNNKKTRKIVFNKDK
jgi:DNA-directed RNA polymerase subunit RPC12/RpoP